MNLLIQGDALEEMRKLESGSIDIAVTSPPYNLAKTSGGGMKKSKGAGKWASAALADGYDDHDDEMPEDDYIEWQRACLTEMMRIVADNGAIFYNHKWRVQNGLLQDRAKIVEGFPVRQIIIWQRAGGINFHDTYFLPTYEVIYLIAKPSFRLRGKANALGDVWTVRQEMNNEHPAPFPVEIPSRCIRSTYARTVLDPFMGSGTTAIAALDNDAEFVGIEKSGRYIGMSRDRIELHEKGLPPLTMNTKRRRPIKKDQLTLADMGF